MTGTDTGSADSRARRGRRPTLSLEQVVDEAVSLLDARGASHLTLRRLADNLDTGVGSLYHYVSGKEELLDRATNEVLGDVLASLSLPDDPFDALEELSMTFYETMDRHRWLGAYMLRDVTMQPNSMRMFELFGQQLMGLDLTPMQRFDAVSSLISFVTGVGAEMRELPPEVTKEHLDQRQALHRFAVAWRKLDAEEFPFVHSVVDVFESHEDEAQFRAGVELILAGIRVQAGVSPG